MITNVPELVYMSIVAVLYLATSTWAFTVLVPGSFDRTNAVLAGIISFFPFVGFQMAAIVKLEAYLHRKDLERGE